MKKILALSLSLALVLSLGLRAAAEEGADVLRFENTVEASPLNEGDADVLYLTEDGEVYDELLASPEPTDEAYMEIMPLMADGLTTASEPAAWARSGLVESEALGFAPDHSILWEHITLETLSPITAAVAEKLALLELPTREAAFAGPFVGTRGAIISELYHQVRRYEIPGVEEPDGVAFFQNLGILQGDHSGDLRLAEPCTVQEAVIFAQRLVLAVYDLCDAGTRGLLWRATNGGNTLYLFGTAHVDRNNLYPLHQSVRTAMAEADEAIFELDLNDTAGMEELAAMQMYSDGTTLVDHVSPELYEQTMATLLSLYLPEGTDEATQAAVEAQLSIFKPWALALTLQNLMMVDTSTGSSILPTDVYLTNLAAARDLPISGVETYALQIAVFDTLSADYQMTMLRDMLSLFAPDSSEAEEGQAALTDALDAFLICWQQGDLSGFEAAYGKGAIAEGENELAAKLFTERDPNMIAAAVQFLEAEGETVYFYAVGAGHMVDPGGIISALEALGYTVELVK